MHDKVKNAIIIINKFESLNDMIEIIIQIDNRQHEKYVDKKVNIKIHLIKKFFKEDLIKLNIIKIEKLRIKIYYLCEKKNYLKRNCL